MSATGGAREKELHNDTYQYVPPLPGSCWEDWEGLGVLQGLGDFLDFLGALLEKGWRKSQGLIEPQLGKWILWHQTTETNENSLQLLQLPC